MDADPSSFPAGPYVAEFGDYVNGEPGRPLLVSLLLYLVLDWERSWDAETLFLDEPSDTGVFVRPKRWGSFPLLWKYLKCGRYGAALFVHG